MREGCSSDPQLSPHALTSQGKFIRINFDVAGYIVGANIETCILPAWGAGGLGAGGAPGREAPGISPLPGSRRLSTRTGSPGSPLRRNRASVPPSVEREGSQNLRKGQRGHLHVEGGGRGLPLRLGEGGHSPAAGRWVGVPYTISGFGGPLGGLRPRHTVTLTP